MTVSLSAPEIVEMIVTDEEAPSSETVHAQAISFYPQHWHKRWPEQLDVDSISILSLDGLDGTGRRTISRSDLFGLGREVETPLDALNFFVAVYSWGVGTFARGVSRGLRVLETDDASGKILGALETLRESDFDPRVGYSAFNNYDQAKLKHLGPAFFTKLLYFYSHDRLSRTTNTPLILDQHVAASLNWDSWGWGSAKYADYISLVDQVRSHLDADLPGDVVEYVLFKHGQRAHMRG